MRLLKLFKRKFRDVKSVFPEQKHIIEWAFNVGGTDYFQFADVFSLPYERGLMAVAVYNEIDMRCSRNYLMKHTETISDLLKQQEIDIFKINTLNEQMKQRLQLVTDVDLLYKIASVVFFDKNENPALYEPDYCKKKIAHWKEHRGVADFFLQKPLMELIPYLQNVEVDLDTFSRLNEDLNELHLERFRMFSSKKA
jgi:hypothetical protein